MISRVTLIAILALTAACSGSSELDEKRDEARDYYRSTNTLIEADDEILDLSGPAASTEDRPAPNPNRNAYFGDLHVHTAQSFDAVAFGTTASPGDAYRYAQGEAIQHPGGFEVQLAQPLDFYAVTDHGMFLGLISEAADTSTKFSQYELSQPYHDINEEVDGGLLDLGSRNNVFSNFIADVVRALLDGTVGEDELNDITSSAWQETIAAADEAYRPGSFTTFAGYEFTSSTAEREALHRNVIFRGTERLPALPFTKLNSMNPEGLWGWMDMMRDRGVESLAIPHNSNGSNGAMFMFTDWSGTPIDQEYADLRLRNEPLVEITQAKGTSETHPMLSKNDEWAGFEIFPYRTATTIDSDPPGSYVRDAWQRGLALQERGGGNPYKFGVIGSSDTHTGAASLQEDNYFGKIGAMDDSAEKRGSIPASWLYGTMVSMAADDMVVDVEGNSYLDFAGYHYWGASGIAGVWAEENTREAIYDALRRKETFATSGTRIKVRFFASYDLSEDQLDQPELVRSLYENGVTMGGSLRPSGDRAPAFLTWAMADPNTARLQRVQVIKGWLENGEHREQVYDVACSDGLSVDPETHRCPDNGARVNLEDCSITAGVGASELKTVWRDPNFVAGQEAFYYVRVLENPVCRWSTWDALRAGYAPRQDLPTTIQERAWSSPIWYSSSNASNTFAR
ncbi:DUF3604 domain-containing protein [Erythrobacter sp. Alg231-14]|uniref:DUF3604 domain-containing protein n=1 Tax=Erythrobacter sp. Alg231-14 TaxID=1922225 RepID=UPI000D554422